MSLLDSVPGEPNLCIGGEALHAAGITHVLSVLRLPLDHKLFEGFEHKVVEVDDVEDENLLEHFPACNNFIQDALDTGGGVLVHCAMGKSRSATIMCAYLMRRHGIKPDQALARIRESRPLCEPNEGFWKQLQLYHRMATPEDMESAPAYQRWLYQREVELSRACGQAPEAEKIRFEDEHKQNEASDFEMRCRKCRRPLATSQFLAEHSSPATNPATGKCTHYFLDPLSWMKPELEQGKLDGRLECPKCKANVGKYAWQGMQCSCGDWIVPGISLARGRIDETKSRQPGGNKIRMPPSADGQRIREGGGLLAKENL